MSAPCLIHGESCPETHYQKQHLADRARIKELEAKVLSLETQIRLLAKSPLRVLK